MQRTASPWIIDTSQPVCDKYWILQLDMSTWDGIWIQMYSSVIIGKIQILKKSEDSIILSVLRLNSAQSCYKESKTLHLYKNQNNMIFRYYMAIEYIC